MNNKPLNEPFRYNDQIITLKQEPFPAAYIYNHQKEIDNGEIWEAYGVDQNGNDVNVYWHFEESLEDAADYNWDDIYDVIMV